MKKINITYVVVAIIIASGIVGYGYVNYKKKEMELTFEVSQKEYEQYGDIIYERTGKSDQFKHRISGIVLTYQNVKDINCECIIAQTNCEMYEISFGNRFWVTLIIINVPKEIIIQNNTYKSCGNIS